MTTERINPVISTDPATTARLEAQITEWKAALRLHEKDLKEMGNRSGFKAERKATKATIETCETTIKGLTAKLPPTFVEPRLAAERVRQAVRSLDKLERAKAAFQEDFEKDPVYAILWRSGDVVQAKTAADYVSRLLHALEEKAVEEMPEIIKDFLAKVSRDVIAGVRDSHSTSPFDNAIEMNVQTARAELVSGFSGSLEGLQWEAEAWVKQVKDTKPVRDMWLRIEADVAASEAKAEKADPDQPLYEADAWSDDGMVKRATPEPDDDQGDNSRANIDHAPYVEMSEGEEPEYDAD